MQVFPRIKKPDVIVDNIFRLFDTEGKGMVAFRELLMTFTMSMEGSPRDKLHWIFRLYDKDGNEEIDEDEMSDIFVRLYKVAIGAEAAANPQPEPEPPEIIEKPPTPPPKEEKKPKKKKKPSAREDIQVKTMSSKLSSRNTLKPKTVRKKRNSKTEQELAEEAAAAAKAKEEAEAAERAAAEKAAAEEKKDSDEDDEEKEPPFDPVKRALEIFYDLDVNKDGVVTEEEFVEGCLTDPNFLFMLENFSCDFIWGDEDFK